MKITKIESLKEATIAVSNREKTCTGSIIKNGKEVFQYTDGTADGGQLVKIGERFICELENTNEKQNQD